MIVARFAAVDQVQVDAALTEAEGVRHQRLRFASDRDAYRAAHLLVRACAGELLGVAPRLVRVEQACPRCGKAGHGRPFIAGEPGVTVSLSHTRGFVAAVAATVACGIDVEAVATAIPRTAVTTRERAWLDARPDPLRAFTQLWVRKEALVKAGVADDPASIDVLADDAVPGPAGRFGEFTLIGWSGPVDALGRPMALGCVAVRTLSARESGSLPSGEPAGRDVSVSEVSQVSPRRETTVLARPVRPWPDPGDETSVIERSGPLHNSHFSAAGTGRANAGLEYASIPAGDPTCAVRTPPGW